MKNYIYNINALHIRYVLINLIVALVAFFLSKLIGNIGLDTKINMYISILMMVLILFFFISGRKRYIIQLDKIKTLSLGKKLNEYHYINKKR